MKTANVFMLFVVMLAAVSVCAQITPPRTATNSPIDPPQRIPKYTNDFKVFIGAKTYYVHDNPKITEKYQLQGLAAALEEYAGLVPADTPEAADVRVVCYKAGGGKEVVYSRPGYGGVVSTNAVTQEILYFECYHGSTLVYAWTPAGPTPGPDFGKKMGKNIAKVNKKK